MDAPFMNGEPGARMSDPEWDVRHEPIAANVRCETCGAVGYLGFVTDGRPLTTRCPKCDRDWRIAQQHPTATPARGAE